MRAFLLEHIRKLSQRFDVTVIVKTNNSYLFKELNIDATVIPFDIAREIDWVADVVSLWGLVKILRKRRFDAVHTITPKAGLLGMLAAKFTFVKVRVHTFQGEVWVTRKGFMRWLLKVLDKLVATIATHITVVSSSERDFLVSQNIITRKKSRVFNYGSIAGVNLKKFTQNDVIRSQLRASLNIDINDTVILYIGRVNKDKGVLDLVAAFNQIEDPHCQLLIVGPDEHNLLPTIQSILQNKLPRLHLVGETNEPQKYMAASDIVSLPSYREGFGVVLIESAACGVTSVASNIYGISDAVVDAETGLLHEPGNIEDIRKKIQHLVDNPKLRNRLSENACVRVKTHFDSNILTQSWFDFYIGLIAK